MTSPIKCIELSNSYEIDLNYGSFSHCCKMKSMGFNKKEVELYGGKYLDLNKQTVKARSDLLNGIQTPICNDCWTNENNNLLSWRVMRNEKARDNVMTLGLQISTLCNQACYYCIPRLSSTINKYSSWIHSDTAEEVPTDRNYDYYNFLNTDHINEFIESISENIDTLVVSITGGEPFMLENFETIPVQFIETFLKLRPNNRVTLVVSTNANAKPEKLLKFYENTKKLNYQGRFDITISCSLENLEERAEYVRDGLIWSNFLENYNIHKTHADKILIRMTVNPFTVVKISDFVKFFANDPINFCYNYPHQLFYRINVLDDRFKPELAKLEDYVIKTGTQGKFETEFFKDLSNFISNDVVNADKFRSAITSLDRIKNKNWRTVFPEYIDWFDKILPQ